MFIVLKQTSVYSVNKNSVYIEKARWQIFNRDSVVSYAHAVLMVSCVLCEER
jgi:hypothetical protein